jgi:pilus assembly protein Flp/PilA
MLEMAKRFLKDDDGASMAEYAILLAVITGALVTILGLYTNSIANIFNFIIQQLDAARQAAAS